MGKQAQRERRAETERFWRREVEGQAASGLSVRVWCQRRRISEPSFYHWRAELNRRISASSGSNAPAAKVAMRAKKAVSTNFVPVRLTTSTSQVEFALASGLVIRVPAQDVAALRAILALLEPCSC